MPDGGGRIQSVAQLQDVAQPVIRKTAAGKQQKSLTYVLSDATIDHYGDTINPHGWEVKWFKQNPIALFNHNPNMPIGKWRNVRTESDQLVADLEPVQRGTSHRLDEIISLIEQDILRATSVGFRSLEDEPLDPKNPLNGKHYKRQVLLEASVVSVPANPAALQVAKSMNISDETLTLAFGEHAVMKRRDMSTGEHADHQSPMKGIPMSLSKQIEEHNDRLNAARDKLTDLVKEPDYNEIEVNALNDEIDAVTKKLATLERSERSLATRTVQQAEIRSPAVLRRPLDVPAPKVEKQDYLWRAAS